MTMNQNENKKFLCLSVMIGAAGMMLLKICDEANMLSFALAILTMTALVYSIRHASSKKEYGLIAGIMAITFAVRFYGYTGSPAADVLLGLLGGLIMFGLFLSERLFRKFEDRFWYTLIFPLIYLLFMYFTETVKINMPFRMDIYCSHFLLLCQITALLGIYSLDFFMAWTASVIVFLADHAVVCKFDHKGDYTAVCKFDHKGDHTAVCKFDHKGDHTAVCKFGHEGDHTSGEKINHISYRQCRILALLYIISLCGIMGFGFVHLEKMNRLEAAKKEKVRVACATGPYYGPASNTSYTDLTMEDTLASLKGIVKDAAEQKAEILVFCEEAYSVSDHDEDALITEAKELAAENDMHVLLAYEVGDTDGSEDGKSINKLCWISNEGQVIYDYIKHCLVPIVETADYVRGDKNIEAFDIQVNGKTLKVATAICYDADFDLFMSHMGKDVDLLLLPTWDWSAIAEEHFSVARLRAISTETSLVRSVYDGWNAVIDSAGNVLLRENTNEVGYEKVIIYDL